MLSFTELLIKTLFLVHRNYVIESFPDMKGNIFKTPGNNRQRSLKVNCCAMITILVSRCARCHVLIAFLLHSQKLFWIVQFYIFMFLLNILYCICILLIRFHFKATLLLIMRQSPKVWILGKFARINCHGVPPNSIPPNSMTVFIQLHHLGSPVFIN